MPLLVSTLLATPKTCLFWEMYKKVWKERNTHKISELRIDQQKFGNSRGRLQRYPEYAPDSPLPEEGLKHAEDASSGGESRCALNGLEINLCALADAENKRPRPNGNKHIVTA